MFSVTCRLFHKWGYHIASLTISHTKLCCYLLEKICLFQLNNNACWDGTHFHGKCPINHGITICSQLVKKQSQVLEENLVKTTSRLSSCFPPSRRHCLLCLCNLMLWKKESDVRVSKRIDWSQCNPCFHHWYSLKTGLDSSLKTLYNSSLASQCGTTTVESGH